MNGRIDTFCQELSPFLQVIGQALNIFKISLPIILIILGIIDIGRVVVSSKSEDIKKHFKTLGFKVATCIVVFFIPTLVMIVFGFVGKFSDIIDNSGVDYNVCYNCIFKPNSPECQKAITLSQENS